jgi:hypothetical protein
VKAFVLDVKTDTTWRRLRIPSELTLADLHTAIQATTGGNDSQLHRFESHGERVPDTHPLERIFTKLEARIDYVYGTQRYSVVADGLTRQETRSAEDFACLAGDEACDIAKANERLRSVFVTISYHADREPTFDAWNDPSPRALFTEAVRLHLMQRDSKLSASAARERARLQAEVEQGLTSDLMLKAKVEKLCAEGQSRSQAIETLVTALEKQNARTRNQRRRRR